MKNPTEKNDEHSKKNPTDKGAHVKIYDYSLFFIKFILVKEEPDFKVY